MSSGKTSKTSVPPSHVSETLQIDVDNIVVRFGAQNVLDNVSLCVHKGEFIGLIGPNGAGKTTLLRALLGLLEPEAGAVARPGAVLGYVPQRGALYDGTVPISVLEVVRLGATGASKHDAMQALRMVRMEAEAGKRFTELSGGQQQRVTIAKALAARADVLILDEPATGIDEHSQTAFYELLGSLHQSGTTIIMVSHEVDTVLKLVTRVICLNGSVVYDGSPEHFEADKYLPQTYAKYHRQLHHRHGGGNA